ncbi:unnamed protein product [Vitrella brassicaformis CCMP3155]|uniref:Uncharacterized protein n=3 Tax=Vitrella brassicaformis TaxID=1169539 RepID=A0A0G4EB01_VITBC|nr:unnamed protein product [Vitrella brassicaformis CCMP3155]|eukprot:CEL92849.1 unnamed protein product [Vitrella brassicaformis CCMP3155]
MALSSARMVHRGQALFFPPPLDLHRRAATDQSHASKGIQKATPSPPLSALSSQSPPETRPPSVLSSSRQESGDLAGLARQRFGTQTSHRPQDGTGPIPRVVGLPPKVPRGHGTPVEVLEAQPVSSTRARRGQESGRGDDARAKPVSNASPLRPADGPLYRLPTQYTVVETPLHPANQSLASPSPFGNDSPSPQVIPLFSKKWRVGPPPSPVPMKQERMGALSVSPVLPTAEPHFDASDKGRGRVRDWGRVEELIRVDDRPFDECPDAWLPGHTCDATCELLYQLKNEPFSPPPVPSTPPRPQPPPPCSLQIPSPLAAPQQRSDGSGDAAAASAGHSKPGAKMESPSHLSRPPLPPTSAKPKPSAPLRALAHGDAMACISANHAVEEAAPIPSIRKHQPPSPPAPAAVDVSDASPHVARMHRSASVRSWGGSSSGSMPSSRASQDPGAGACAVPPLALDNIPVLKMADERRAGTRTGSKALSLLKSTCRTSISAAVATEDSENEPQGEGPATPNPTPLRRRITTGTRLPSKAPTSHPPCPASIDTSRRAFSEMDACSRRGEADESSTPLCDRHESPASTSRARGAAGRGLSSVLGHLPELLKAHVEHAAALERLLDRPRSRLLRRRSVAAQEKRSERAADQEREAQAEQSIMSPVAPQPSAAPQPGSLSPLPPRPLSPSCPCLSSPLRRELQALSEEIECLRETERVGKGGSDACRTWR